MAERQTHHEKLMIRRQSSHPRISVAFETGNDFTLPQIILLTYRFPSALKAYLIDTTPGPDIMYGISRPVTILATIQKSRQLNKFRKVVEQIFRHSPPLLHTLDAGFWSFLTLYTEQREINKNRILGELEKYERKEAYS